MKRHWLAVVSIALFNSCLIQATPARADLGGIIYGTGTNGRQTRDPYWQVLAVGDNIQTSDVIPYAAYTYEQAALAWAGSGGFEQPQVGLTTADGTYYWIGHNPTRSAGFPIDYNYIIAQKFTSAVDGIFQLSFPMLADNFSEIYINGSISNANPVKPTILGGTLIGTTTSFTTPTPIVANAPLNAGDNWVYAVVNELGFDTGLLMTQATFNYVGPINPVPGPTPLLGATAAFAFSRRLRRRISRANLPAGDPEETMESTIN